MHLLEVYKDVSEAEAEHPSLNTKIHAVVQLVSLMTHFNGDGKSMMCIVFISQSTFACAFML